MESRIFTTGQYYMHLVRAFSSVPSMLRSSRSGTISKVFSEKLMLAVTRVNGCRYCSWFHTRQALLQGMEQGEILNLLKGDLGDISKNDLQALLYAQHYADKGGKPDPGSKQKLVKTYGGRKARGIEASIRAITVGNIYGIALDAFQRRFRGKRMKDSKLVHELGILVGTLLFFPVALLHSFFYLSRALRRDGQYI